MGASAAVTRVLVVAMVRDLFEREAMARVMSLVFMVFMLMPVLAPNIGLAILLVAPWRGDIRGSCRLRPCNVALVVAFGSQRPSSRISPQPHVARHGGELSGRRFASRSLAATLSALTISFGVLVAYIASIQQIVFEAFHEPRLIGAVFAAIAAPMALASWTNSRVVGRFGLRRVGHTAQLPLSWSLRSSTRCVALSGHETLARFILLQALTMCAFAFTSSNLSTLAMEHMAPIAGTASSVQGMIGTIGGAIFGFLIGRHFDGTILPYLVGTAACATVRIRRAVADRAEAAVRTNRG